MKIRFLVFAVCSMFIMNGLLYADSKKGAELKRAYGITFDNADLKEIRSKLCKILEKICALEDIVVPSITKCDVLITQNDIPLVITEPGLYCLMEDVTSSGDFAIQVDADCVVIDMCHHVINGNSLGTTGIEILGPHNTIAIFNGTFKNLEQGIANTDDETVLSNLFFHNLNFVRIERDVINMHSNITTNDVANIIIDRINTTQSGSLDIRATTAQIQNSIFGPSSVEHGIILRGLNAGADNAQQLTVDNCHVQPGAGSGIVFFNAQNVTISGCEVAGLTGQGYSISETANMVLSNCSAQECTLDGFAVEQNTISSASIVLSDCKAQQCGIQTGNLNHGFSFIANDSTNLNNIKFINCCAQDGNGSGFEFELGGTSNLDNLIIQNCVSQNNTRCGFEILTAAATTNVVTNLEFENCVAQDNGSDAFSYLLRNAGDTLDHAVFTNCIAQQSVGNDVGGVSYAGDGFAFGTSSDSNGTFADLVFVGCIAQDNNSDGFEFRNTNTISLKCCVANLNADGFDIQGPNPNSSFNVVFEQCSAQGNTSQGFDLQDIVNAVLIGCTAQDSSLENFDFERVINLTVVDCHAFKSDGEQGFTIRDVSNFSLDNSTAINNSGTGIEIVTSNNGSITNCKSIASVTGVGILVVQGQNIVIKNSDVIANSSHGIFFDTPTAFAGDNYKIIDCCSQDNGHDGFGVSAFNNSTFRYIEFENCAAQDNAGEGFYLRPFSGNQIEHVVFKNCIAQGNRGVASGASGDGFRIGENGVVQEITFNNCVANANADDGFDFQETSSVIMNCCTANANSSRGFTVQDGFYYSLSECYTDGNASDGFRFLDSINISLIRGASISNGLLGIRFNNVINAYVDFMNVERALGGPGIRWVDSSNITCLNSSVIESVFNGIVLRTSSTATIENCVGQRNGNSNFRADDSSGIIFKNCVSEETLGASFPGFAVRVDTINAIENLKFIDCVAQRSNASGFRVLAVAGTAKTIDNLIFQNCTSQDNRDAGFELTVQNANDLLSSVMFKNCFAQCNRGESGDGDGFAISSFTGSVGSTRDITFENCVAQNNAEDGFDLCETFTLSLKCCSAENNASVGFSFLDGENVLLQECRAVANMDAGFDFLRINKMSVHDCQAVGNTASGFNLDDITNGDIIDSTSNANALDGFSLTSSTTCIKLLDNCAVSNAVNGFNDAAILGSNFMLGNAAFCNVAADYAGVGIEPRLRATGAAELTTASRWINASA